MASGVGGATVDSAKVVDGSLGSAVVGGSLVSAGAIVASGGSSGPGDDTSHARAAHRAHQGPAAMTYEELIESKTQFAGDSGFAATWILSLLFPFQADLSAWAIKRGRSALFVMPSVIYVFRPDFIFGRKDKPVLAKVLTQAH